MDGVISQKDRRAGCEGKAAVGVVAFFRRIGGMDFRGQDVFGLVGVVRGSDEDAEEQSTQEGEEADFAAG